MRRTFLRSSPLFAWLGLVTLSAVGCGHAADPAPEDSANDELFGFSGAGEGPARFAPKPGAYVGKSVHMSMIRRGDQLVARVAMPDGTYGGSAPLAPAAVGAEAAATATPSDTASGYSIQVVDRQGGALEVRGLVGTTSVRETLNLRPLAAWNGTYVNPSSRSRLRITKADGSGAAYSTDGGPSRAVKWNDVGVTLSTVNDGELTLVENGVYWYGVETWIRQPE